MSASPLMTDQITDLVAALRRDLGRLDPDGIPVDEVPTVIARLAQGKKLFDGALTLMARRAEDARDRTTEDHRTPEDMLANLTGTSRATAKKQLNASKQLEDQPDVAAAVKAGELSTEQASAVSDAVAADPEAATDLLGTAKAGSLQDLRNACRDRTSRADDNPDQTRRRHYLRRSFRSWLESDGEWRASISAPSDIGARLEAALRAEHDQIFRAAHADGRREHDGAYRLDALMAVAERGPVCGNHSSSPPVDLGRDRAESGPSGSGQANSDEPTTTEPLTRSAAHEATRATKGAAPRRSGRQTKVIVNVDGAALKRGWLEGDETCDIAGIGRVSLAAVKQLIPEAHIAYVIRNGQDVSVAHLGRQVTARQRTALEARGYQCEVPGCTTSHLLEIDHITGWAITRTTSLDDLAWLCPFHHAQKTDRGYHLRGSPGHRTWMTQGGTVVATDVLGASTDASANHSTGAEPEVKRAKAADPHRPPIQRQLVPI